METALIKRESNELAEVNIPADIRQAIERACAELDSPHTRRLYQSHVANFWGYLLRTGQGVERESLAAYRNDLAAQGKSSSAINLRMSAVRYFIRYASDKKIIGRDEAEDTCKAKGVTARGKRLGNWLTLEQAEAVINAPDVSTAMGLRDRAALALMLGSGLRRAEAAALTVEHLQQREGRWVIVDLIGKRNKTRSVPLGSAYKGLLDEWCEAAGVTSGPILRQCSWAKDRFTVSESGVSTEAIRRIVQRYTKPLGIAGINPHDMRRTFAKLSRKGGAAIEQIQLSLGHENLDTTKTYLGDEQDLQNAPSDAIKLRIEKKTP